MVEIKVRFYNNGLFNTFLLKNSILNRFKTGSKFLTDKGFISLLKKIQTDVYLILKQINQYIFFCIPIIITG